MKLIVTSATMDAKKFADFFGNVPTFQVRVITFVRNGVQLEWVKKFVSVLCLEASRASMFVCLFVSCFSLYFLVVKTKGFSCQPGLQKSKKFSNAGLMRVAFTPGYIHTTADSYNPGQKSWDTNAIARQIEASSLSPSPFPLPPSPSVQC